MTLQAHSRLRSLIAAFGRDDRGNIAVIFAAVLLPLLMFIGGAVDYGRALTAKQAIGFALDAATLAGAREYVASYGNLGASKAAAEAYFKGQYSDGDYQLTVSVDKDTGLVTATASAEVPAAFLGVIGMQTLAVSSTSTSKFNELRPVSVGMVLDVSGSMSESMPGAANRMASLKSASTALLDILDEANPTGRNVRTGLTTFSTHLVDKISFGYGSSAVRRQIQRLRPLNMTQMNAALDPMAGMIDRETGAFGSTNALRFVILMTDGYSTVSPRRDVAATLANCTALKKDGVEVFTVNLNGDADTLRSCASDANHFFDTRNHSQFKKAFEAIALDILARSIRLAS